MPNYPWLKDDLDASEIQAKMEALTIVGTPYTEDDIKNAPAALEGKTELDAVIAYLQSLGVHVKMTR